MFQEAYTDETAMARAAEIATEAYRHKEGNGGGLTRAQRHSRTSMKWQIYHELISQRNSAMALSLTSWTEKTNNFIKSLVQKMSNKDEEEQRKKKDGDRK